MNDVGASSLASLANASLPQRILPYLETMRPSLGSGDVMSDEAILLMETTRERKYRYHRNKVIIDFDTWASASYERGHFLARCGSIPK